MSEQVERILNMVKDGKVTPEEAETLINAISKKSETSSGSDCHLRIKVLETKSNGQKPTVVKINLPIKVISMLAKSTGKIGLDHVMKHNKVKESLSNYGLKTDADGNIVDIDAFIKALDELCANAPVELVDIVEAENENGESTVVKIFVE